MLNISCPNHINSFHPGLGPSGTVKALLTNDGTAKMDSDGCPSWTGNTAVLGASNVIATPMTSIRLLSQEVVTE